MKIEWIGHACFRIAADDGTVVITDPYDPTVGIDMLPLEADVITMSHEHHDHNETQMIKGSPVILRGGEGAERGGMRITAHASYHDDVQGAKRGPNYIYVFECGGQKVVHMGDQGCMPDEAIIEAIRGADVMMIPAGGTYTVDAAGAKAIVEAAQPRCVIPMHVKTRRCGYPIAAVHAFLEAMGVPSLPPVQALPCGAQGVVLLAPKADKLW
ncbi:MAG: MBL fold metallo-hydrolase [Clostridia bacterium]|nr:MBL fold metallo-hydrolase [Clostridia bacterium]